MGVISGMRYNTEIAIWVNLPEALKNSVPFFLSKNQVILSPGIEGVVPPRFLERVTDLVTGAQLWPDADAGIVPSSADNCAGSTTRCSFDTVDAALLVARLDCDEIGT